MNKKLISLGLGLLVVFFAYKSLTAPLLPFGGEKPLISGATITVKGYVSSNQPNKDWIQYLDIRIEGNNCYLYDLSIIRGEYIGGHFGYDCEVLSRSSAEVLIEYRDSLITINKNGAVGLNDDGAFRLIDKFEMEEVLK